MAQVKRYTAKKNFALDCGHEVREGESFAVTKVFTCEEHAKHVPFAKEEPAPSQK